MSKDILASELINYFEQWAPKNLAYDWDNVGLQVGTLNKPVNKVMVTLDVMESVVDEAIEKDVDLIIAHHPVLFKSLKQINIDDPKGKILLKLLKHDITVYAAHTNLDIVDGGVSDMLAKRLGVHNTEVLVSSETEQLFKLVVYVPETHAEQLKQAIGNAGTGHIGNYSHCSFQTQGIGSFKPLEGADPFIGNKGKLEIVKEAKVETLITKKQVNSILSIIREVHPYEEVAYDLLRLENKGNNIGVGRVGVLKNKVKLKAFCDHVKEKLDVPTLRVTGDLNQEIQRVAILGGSGEDYIQAAIKARADVYLTGDLTFHDAQDAWQMGLNLIDPGHHVEKVMKQGVKDYLDPFVKDTNVEVLISSSNTEPFQFL
ncbi:Nif3-like dinuclear metal center hexameric protein [Aquibacillus kalidii]|uniref:Nif3-like dinuclear metal center hexameric protein n=1 Tax=Aquibacillus kalidii TaxID=2762597 RepID=UPI0016494EF1|nr:Nif3-like dinuclear metal center hexameric protein [Aquibacillus kalidii]